MAHTVIDDPAPPGGQPPPYGVPPHGPYGHSPYPHPGHSPRGGAPRRGVPRWLLIAGGALLATIGAVVIVYFAVFHYTPVALHHVPAGTTVAVRVDFADVVLFAPVRRHLLPLADEPPAGGAPAGKPRTERIASAVGFSPSRDLREAVVCFLGSEDKVVLVVGGNIPKGKLVPGLLKVAQEEGSQDWVDGGGYLKAKYGGLYVGQADDGSAIVATDEAALQAALPSSSEYQRLGIPEGKAVAYAATGQLWRDVSHSSYASMLESLGNLKTLDGANGYMTLGNNPRLDSQVVVAAGANPEDAKGTLYRVFTDLRRVSELRRRVTGSGQDLAGEEQALAQSTIETKPPNVLRVVTPWPYDGLDRGAQNLAAKIRKVKAGLGKPPEPPGNLKVPVGLPGLPGGIQLPIPGLP